MSRTPPKSLEFTLSNGYRSGRRILSVVCALAIAWAGAQFEFKSVNVTIGQLDIGNASIRALFMAAVAYATVRLVIEYVMHPAEVRRWRYAQWDVMVSINLVRVTILIVAASGLDRSPETVLYLVLAGAGTLVVFAIVAVLGMFALIPLFGRKRKSIASAVMEALAWSEVTAILAILYGLAILAFAANYSTTVGDLWNSQASPMAPGLFALASAIVVLSFAYERPIKEFMFSIPPRYINHRTPEGSELTMGQTLPALTVDWYMDQKSDRIWRRREERRQSAIIAKVRAEDQAKSKGTSVF